MTKNYDYFLWVMFAYLDVSKESNCATEAFDETLISPSLHG